MAQSKNNGKDRNIYSDSSQDIYSRSDRNINSPTLNDIINSSSRRVPENTAKPNPNRRIVPKRKNKRKLTDQEIYAQAARERRAAVSAAIARKKRQKTLKRTAAVVCIAAVLAITVSLAVTTGIFEDKSVAPVNTAAESIKDTKPEISQESVQSSVVSSEPEESHILNNPTSSRNFTAANDKFTEAQNEKLNKELTSEFIVLYDMTSDEILYQKNGDKKLYPASTTKILTAIVACSIIDDPDKVLTVGDEIDLIGEESSIAGLQKGMRLTFETLLDALLLPSGNDAAYTIAVNCARIYEGNDKLSSSESVRIFMELVNECAKELGAENTHFVTPDGWHNDDHYTTATDLARFAAYAKSIPMIQKSCSKSYASWELIDGGTLEWENSNKLILPDSEVYSPYCDGMKTGFTDEAGSSVVSSATIGGHTLIAVVMNGQTMYTKYFDANYLFEEGFALNHFEYTYNKPDSQEDLSDEIT